MRASSAGFSIVSKSLRASACGRAFLTQSLTDSVDDTAEDPIGVPGVPGDDPIEDSTDDPSDDLTDDPTDDPTDDSTDDPVDAPHVVPTDDPIVDLSSMDLDVPTVVPTVVPSDDSIEDATDDPTNLNDPFAEGRHDRAAMTTSAARWVSDRISVASLAIVSESRRAPKSRRAFSWRSVRTSPADPSAACVFTDESGIAVVSNVAVVSRCCSFV